MKKISGKMDKSKTYKEFLHASLLLNLCKCLIYPPFYLFLASGRIHNRQSTLLIYIYIYIYIYILKGLIVGCWKGRTSAFQPEEITSKGT